jgi:hypothetical protein
MRVAAELRPSRLFSFLAKDSVFPLMDSSSAVEPTVRLAESSLALAYFLPECQDSAVVQFIGLERWYFGTPSDERLNEHPLWNKGLEFYEFHQMQPQRKGQPSGWLASFHDGTLEVLAIAVQVRSPRLSGGSPASALNQLLGPGDNLTL